jgi:general secretion pathway protein G
MSVTRVNWRKQCGTTLLELMLVVAVGCLIAAVAVPGYVNYVDRVRVSRAISEVGALSLEISRWQTSFGDFPASLAAAGIAETLDPWGNPYIYLNVATATKGQVRKDKNLNPVNNDFDLYSMGKDGSTATAFPAKAARDDIVRANNGNFIGLAEDY